MIILKHGTYGKLKKKTYYNMYCRETVNGDWLWTDHGTPKDLYTTLELYSRLSHYKDLEYAVKEATQ